jgi:hypothetical protein
MAENTMTPKEARETLGRYYILAAGRARIQDAEKRLGVRVDEVLRDDDLVVIFAQSVKDNA